MSNGADGFTFARLLAERVSNVMPALRVSLEAKSVTALTLSLKSLQKVLNSTNPDEVECDAKKWDLHLRLLLIAGKKSTLDSEDETPGPMMQACYGPGFIADFLKSNKTRETWLRTARRDDAAPCKESKLDYRSWKKLHRSVYVMNRYLFMTKAERAIRRCQNHVARARNFPFQRIMSNKDEKTSAASAAATNQRRTPLLRVKATNQRRTPLLRVKATNQRRTPLLRVKAGTQQRKPMLRVKMPASKRRPGPPSRGGAGKGGGRKANEATLSASPSPAALAACSSEDAAERRTRVTTKMPAKAPEETNGHPRSRAAGDTAAAFGSPSVVGGSSSGSAAPPGKRVHRPWEQHQQRQQQQQYQHDFGRCGEEHHCDNH
eukprot:TRINITY_DN16341_c0_g1_i1.p1 TRINITY_DN16341_c0_g1~~TRINITY_DN16341_c0_g1_i1.p1  ORF type:complete len:393 (+),score=66.42 TRINITY_DN16341_c0_g1_i1:54-1181(+)